MSAIKSFSKKEAIRFGWETTKKNFWLLAGVSLITLLIEFIPNIFSSYLKDQLLLSFILNIIIYVVSLGVGLGAIKINLSFVDKRVPQFSDLFSLFNTKILSTYFLAALRLGAITLLSALPALIVFTLVIILVSVNKFPFPYAVIFIAIGAVLTLLIGYVSIRYSFFIYFIVDKNASVKESLSSSNLVTKGVVIDLLLFNLLLGFIALLGLLALGVGLFVAMPISSLAQAYVYRQLSSRVLTTSQNPVV